eukprot:CAMPEP_0119309486 /NCGR_PEP_ID=MMETSP1333-20130426/15796_1 /TAXON_ID=418940 /ORGANISM="Scyphosphaera apsteinii, Strain RCC1455" /LENGTH=211 /DNA_ID=CAMNT_0007313473 /DNA_START=185 /DNA_END=820 /DNA_ORIENTATION=+
MSKDSVEEDKQSSGAEAVPVPREEQNDLMEGTLLAIGKAESQLRLTGVTTTGSSPDEAVEVSSVAIEAVEESFGTMQLGKDLRDAALGGDSTLVRRLVQQGANVNAAGGVMEQTPLHIAALKGHNNVVRCLVELGADINSTAAPGGTAMHWAAYNGHESTLTLLKDLGANVDIANDKGITPFGVARNRGHAKCVALIEAWGNESGEAAVGQ